jgi:hypothetical protein
MNTQSTDWAGQTLYAGIDNHKKKFHVSSTIYSIAPPTSTEAEKC